MGCADNFFIKPGYSSRSSSQYFEDSLVSGGGVLHQPDVYSLAASLGRKFGCTHILDIGCGRGHKLVKLHPEFKLVGVDFGDNILFCGNHYPFGQWFSHDFEIPMGHFLPQEILEKTLIICSDVIEHLINPAALLNGLSYFLEYAPVAILTTPERDLVRGDDDMGPPANPAHVREWNRAELSELLSAFSFQIGFFGLTCNNDRDWEKRTILSVLHGKRLLLRGQAMNSPFRVVAFMTAYNEEDIIYSSVTRLLRAGVEVYLIDNWSSDSTVAEVEPLLGRGLIGIERFPADGDTGVYDWAKLLTRVEELANIIQADWFIHHDIDEIRESPWPELPLKKALQYVDRLGFNAVDHTVINFHPIDNGFAVGSDFGSYFTHWDFGNRPGHFQQVKAWKNLGQRIALADSGGHNVDFAGRKVFPYKFLLRHYPIRSQRHGDKKVFGERKPRFSLAEKGWHIQYDHIEKGHSFLHEPESLRFFDPCSFYQQYLVERISGIGIVRQKNDTLEGLPRTGLIQWLRSLLGLA